MDMRQELEKVALFGFGKSKAQKEAEKKREEYNNKVQTQEWKDERNNFYNSFKPDMNFEDGINANHYSELMEGVEQGLISADKHPTLFSNFNDYQNAINNLPGPEKKAGIATKDILDIPSVMKSKPVAYGSFTADDNNYDVRQIDKKNYAIHRRNEPQNARLLDMNDSDTAKVIYEQYKEAGEYDEVFPFSHKDSGSLESQVDRAREKVEKEKPTTLAPRGTVENKQEEEKLAYANKGSKIRTGLQAAAMIGAPVAGAVAGVNKHTEMNEQKENIESIKNQISQTLDPKNKGEEYLKQQIAKYLTPSFNNVEVNEKTADVVNEHNKMNEQKEKIEPVKNQMPLSLNTQNKGEEYLKQQIAKYLRPSFNNVEVNEKTAGFNLSTKLNQIGSRTKELITGSKINKLKSTVDRRSNAWSKVIHDKDRVFSSNYKDRAFKSYAKSVDALNKEKSTVKKARGVAGATAGVAIGSGAAGIAVNSKDNNEKTAGFDVKKLRQIGSRTKELITGSKVKEIKSKFNPGIDTNKGVLNSLNNIKANGIKSGEIEPKQFGIINNSIGAAKKEISDATALRNKELIPEQAKRVALGAGVTGATIGGVAAINSKNNNEKTASFDTKEAVKKLRHAGKRTKELVTGSKVKEIKSRFNPGIDTNKGVLNSLNNIKANGIKSGDLTPKHYGIINNSIGAAKKEISDATALRNKELIPEQAKRVALGTGVAGAVGAGAGVANAVSKNEKKDSEKTAHIIDLNQLLEKTASLKPITDEQCQVIADIMNKKAHLDNKAYITKLASEADSDKITRNEQSKIESVVNFKFDDIARMEHGDVIIFPEMVNNEFSLTPAIVFSNTSNWLEKDKEKPNKFIISNDGRVKIINGDKFLCRKAPDKKFRLPRMAVGQLQENDRYFVIDGDKVSTPYSVRSVFKEKANYKDEATVVRTRIVSGSMDKDSIFRKGSYVEMYTLPGRKFEEISKDEFASTLLKNNIVNEDAIRTVLSRNSEDEKILSVDSEEKVFKITGTILNHYKNNDELNNQGQLLDAGYELDKVAFSVNSITIYCCDRRGELFNLNVEYKDTESRLMNLRRLTFNRIKLGKLKAILRILKFDGGKLQEVIYKAKNEPKCSYPLSKECTIEDIKKIDGGNITNVSSQNIKSAIGHYVNPAEIGKTLVSAGIGALTTDAVMNAAKNPNIRGHINKGFDILGKISNESKELSLTLEKLAQEQESDYILDMAKVVTLSHLYMDKVAHIVSDDKNYYPDLKGLSKEITYTRPILEKMAYDLTKVKVNQCMDGSEMIDPITVSRTINSMNELYKVAKVIDRAIKEEDLKFAL